MKDIRITTPCDADWDDMAGDTHRRDCGQCQRSVHDLSTLTRSEADQLVSRRDALDRPPCVRYVADRAGAPIFVPELLRPERHFGRFVAVAALAVVGVGTAALMDDAPIEQRPTAVESAALPGAGSVMAADPLTQLEASVATAIAAAGKGRSTLVVEVAPPVDPEAVAQLRRLIEDAKRASEAAVRAASDALIRAKIRRVQPKPQVIELMMLGDISGPIDVPVGSSELGNLK